MGSILIIGLMIGMRHALEADHLAAMASLTSRRQSLADAVQLGGLWGLGHTITLLFFGLAVIVMDVGIPPHLADGLEMGVGLMLILLGGDVLRRLARDRIHFHKHRHGSGRFHFHAHSHIGESGSHRKDSNHEHAHPQPTRMRALMVGLMHGMAGSAAVILLTSNVAVSPLQGVLYILVFGVGSILGMALLSVVISVPMWLSADRLNWAHRSIQLTIGMLTVGLGFWVLLENRMLLTA